MLTNGLYTDIINEFETYMNTKILWIALLTVLAGTICNGKSTGSLTSRDTLRRAEPRPIVLSEAGARLALQYKSRYETALQVLDQKDQLLSVQAMAIQSLDSTVTRLNRDGQATRNSLAQCQQDLARTRQQLRGARLVNVGLIGGVLLYVAARVGLF